MLLLNILNNEKKLKTSHRIILYIILSLVFAFIYFQLEHDDFIGLNKTSDFYDYVYYSITTQTTIGYGDIAPISKRARIISIIQALLIVVLFSI